MKVLTADFIEFGEFNVNGDYSNLALVHGEYTIQDMTQEEFDDLIATHSDWINLEDWDGEIFFHREAIGVKS